MVGKAALVQIGVEIGALAQMWRSSVAARRFLLPGSKDTFLRSVRKSTGQDTAVARVIGIDDWTWCKAALRHTDLRP